jgi:hypothetical protein
MTHRLIRYRVRPDAIEENQRLVESVFAELRARGPENIRYLTLRGADGTFFHLVASAPGNDTSAVTSLPAFAEFQRGLRDRCVEPPQVLEVTPVGDHRMLLG